MKSPFPPDTTQDYIISLRKEYDLTLRELFFCEYYIKYLNRTKAAELAGYASPASTASFLYAKSNVKRYMSDRFKALRMQNDEILTRLEKMATLDISKYAKIDGTRWNIDLQKLIDDGFGPCIKGIKKTKYGDIVEFHDAVKVTELLGKHAQLFVDVVIKPEEKPSAQELPDDVLAEQTRKAIDAGMLDPDDVTPGEV